MDQNTIEIIGYIAAIGTTISPIPQVLKTITTKNTKGISLIMYVFLNIGVLLWFIYGLLINSYPVFIANGITFVFTLTMLIYKIKYK